jgi:hypothetical protein
MPGVPGRGGPAPKRSDQRHGHLTKAQKAATQKVVVPGRVEQPPLDLEHAHPLAVAMYESLAQSGQAAFMEPSDWQYARWVAYVQSRAAQNPTAMIVMAVDKMLTNLLVVESERRRVKLELERAQVLDVDEAAAVTSLAEYRKPS